MLVRRRQLRREPGRVRRVLGAPRRQPFVEVSARITNFAAQPKEWRAAAPTTHFRKCRDGKADIMGRFGRRHDSRRKTRETGVHRFPRQHTDRLIATGVDGGFPQN